MSSQWWIFATTIGGVLIGGLLTGIGVVVQDTIRSRRERQWAERDHRRDNLYELQSEAQRMFESIGEWVEFQVKGESSGSQTEVAFNARAWWVNALAIRSADQELIDLTEVLLNKAKAARLAKPPVETVRLMDIAFVAMVPWSGRIALLLHNDPKEVKKLDKLRADTTDG
jgi:hypothetical protein